MPNTILIASDKLTVYEPLWLGAADAGYRPRLVDNYIEAARIARDERPDALLLDTEIDGCSVVNLLTKLRLFFGTRHLSILVIGTHDDDDCVRVLEAGADDYVASPFSQKELYARVRAVTRPRLLPAVEQVLSAGRVTLDPASRRVVASADERHAGIMLGPTAFELLRLLFTHADRVLTRLEILEQVWGEQTSKDLRIVDVHVANLRAALRTERLNLRIETVRGKGYKLVTDGCAADSVGV
jgi:two-component system phosphate regulon response regulator PhoB